jgi:hypothetical protein
MQIGDEVCRSIDQSTSRRQEPFAGGRELDTMTRSPEEGRAQVALQLPDEPIQPRRRDAQPDGRKASIGLFREHDERTKALKIR